MVDGAKPQLAIYLMLFEQCSERLYACDVNLIVESIPARRVAELFICCSRTLEQRTDFCAIGDVLLSGSTFGARSTRK